MATDDRKLLSLAAVAAGGTLHFEDYVPWFIGDAPGVEHEWDPLECGEDCQELEAAIQATVEFGKGVVAARSPRDFTNVIHEYFTDNASEEDRQKARRRAVTRLAADLGARLQGRETPSQADSAWVGELLAKHSANSDLAP